MAILLSASPPPPPPAAIAEILSGDSSTFASTVGFWTNSGGTLTRDTTSGHRLFSAAASLKFVTTALAQYIEVPLTVPPGGFVAGKRYDVLAWVKIEESGDHFGDQFTSSVGLQGTDTADTTAPSLPTSISGANSAWAAVWIRWVPSSTRASATYRITRTNTLTTNPLTLHVGYVRAAAIANRADIGLGIGLYPLTATSSVVLSVAGDYISQSPDPGNDPGPEVGLSSFGYASIRARGGQAGVTANFAGNLYVFAQQAATGDFADDGLNVEVGPDFVGYYVTERDSDTVQFYADWSGGYDFEFKDRGSGRHWKAVDSSDNKFNLSDLAGRVLFDTVDPSAGGGVAHQLPAMLLRNNAGVTELWLATGAGATAWAKQTSP